MDGWTCGGGGEVEPRVRMAFEWNFATEAYGLGPVRLREARRAAQPSERRLRDPFR